MFVSSRSLTDGTPSAADHVEGHRCEPQRCPLTYVRSFQGYFRASFGNRYGVEVSFARRRRGTDGKSA